MFNHSLFLAFNNYDKCHSLISITCKIALFDHNTTLCLKTLFRAYNFVIKGITRTLIIFKKPRNITNDFFIHYIFARTFQWTSSECLTNVTITIKVDMVTCIHCENGYQNVTSEAYLETYKHLRPSFL